MQDKWPTSWSVLERLSFKFPRKILTFQSTDRSNVGTSLDFLLTRKVGLLTGKVEEALIAGGSVLGGFAEADLVKTQLSCPSGDRLVRFTYGLTEAADESNEQFGEERLMELLSRHRDSSAENLKQIIFKAVGNSAATPSKTTRPR